MYRVFNTLGFRGKTYNLRLKQGLEVFLEDNLERAMRYYRTESSYRVETQHLLHRLISSFTVEMDQDDKSYIRRIQDQAQILAAGLGLTTSRNRGILHSDTFYANNCMVYMSIGNYNVDGDAITVMTHSHVSLEPVLPTLIELYREEDYSVVHIDVVTLMMQYRAWIKANTNEYGGINGTLPEYLGEVVVPNMLKSHLTVAMRNNYKRVASGSSRSLDDSGDVPFTILRPYRLLHGAMQTVIDNNKDEYHTLSSLAVHLQMAGAFSTLWEAIPELARELSTQSYWVVSVAYLDWVDTILTVKPDIDITQESVKRNAKMAKRFLRISGAMRIYPNDIKSVITSRWEKFVSLMDL